jgi:DNA/RNA endonuclease G (NUC1)
MTNVAPQWQVINAGNWFVVENAVREYAKSKKQDVMITTGTHGVLKIDGFDIILPATPPPAIPAPPVPSHFWKVLHDPGARAAVAFVIVNNPYASEDAGSPGLPVAADRMCSTQCDLLQRLPRNPTPTRGLLMCCSPSDLRKHIASVPNIPGVADLFSSPALENVLRNVK